VIEDPNDIWLRFAIGFFIIFCMALCGIGYWCSQVSLNDKTRQSEQKKQMGNALFVISIMGFVGGPIGIIALFFLKIKKKFIFGPILIIFIAMVAALFISLTIT
jgi:ABC-type nickel/cobalt efflux system permease component RcnA